MFEIFYMGSNDLFNTGMIVDSDRRIHPSNIGLSGQLDHILDKTAIGDLDIPPTIDTLEETATQIPSLISEHINDHILQSTKKADMELTRFCRTLWPYYKEKKKMKQQSNTLDSQ